MNENKKNFFRSRLENIDVNCQHRLPIFTQFRERESWQCYYYILYIAVKLVCYLGCVCVCDLIEIWRWDRKMKSHLPSRVKLDGWLRETILRRWNFFDWIHHYIFRHMSSVAQMSGHAMPATAACCCCENPLIITRSCNCLKLKWSHQEFEFHPPAKWELDLYFCENGRAAAGGPGCCCCCCCPVEERFYRPKSQKGKNVYSSS